MAHEQQIYQKQEMRNDNITYAPFMFPNKLKPVQIQKT